MPALGGLSTAPRQLRGVLPPRRFLPKEHVNINQRSLEDTGGYRRTLEEE